jgi:hypothetical protein
VIRVENYKIVAEKKCKFEIPRHKKARSTIVEELEYMRSLSGSYEALCSAKVNIV